MSPPRRTSANQRSRWRLSAHAASAEATRSRKSCDRPRSANRTKRHAGGGCLPHHEKGDANNRPPFAESSGNTKIMREKCGRYVGVNRLYSWGEDAESHFVQNGFGLRCHFPDSYSTVQENFSPRSPFETLHRSHLPYFPKDHPHRQSNPHEDASSRLVGANRKPNVFIPETSRSSKYLFKKKLSIAFFKN